MTVSFSTLGVDTATSLGTAVAAGSNVKGTAVEFSASTAITCKTLYLYAWASGAAASSAYLIDVMTDASLATVTVPDLYLDFFGGASKRITQQYVVPCDIASGTRLGVRAEGTTGAGTEEVTVAIILCDTALPGLTSVASVAYGTTAGSSDKATSYDPGGSANTKGGYTALSASVSASAQWLYINVGGLRNTTTTTGSYLMDVAIGGAGAESVKIANVPLGVDAGSDYYSPYSLGPFPASDFQSQRLSVNLQSTLTDATDRLVGLMARVITGTPVTAGSGGGGWVLGSGVVR